MNKILDATCEAGIVKVGPISVPDAVILSEGVGASTGILLIEEEESRYVANTTPDLKSAIESTIDALDKIASSLQTIATTLTSIGANMTGPTTAPPPTLAADVITIATNVTAINLEKTALTTLKGMLK
jgi:hypothetical protein